MLHELKKKVKKVNPGMEEAIGMIVPSSVNLIFILLSARASVRSKLNSEPPLRVSLVKSATHSADRWSRRPVVY